MRVVIYSRVSTDAQEQDGTSLETQERASLGFAQERGWAVIETIRDTASGYSLDRPGIVRIRQLMRDGRIDVVLAYAVDRLARNQTKLAVLLDEAQESDVALECVTEKIEDTPLGKLVLSLRAFAAEIEREKISERTTRGKIERARSGKLPQAFGLGCYGYSYNVQSGQRDVDLFQAEIVRRIFRRYAETRSFGRVAKELNDDGIGTFTGSRWHPVTIRQMLFNESYTGRLFFRRTKYVTSRGVNGKRRRRAVDRPEEERILIEGASPRIVDEELWDRVQSILADPTRIARNCTARYDYPLRGRVRCAACGSAMIGQTMRPKGREYHYYCCRVAFDRHATKRCETRNIRAEQLEEGIWREVREILSNPKLVLSEMERAQNRVADPADVSRYEDEIKAVVDRQKKLAELFTLGAVDSDIVQAQGATLKQQRAVLEARLSELQGDSSQARIPVDQERLGRICQEIESWLDEAGDGDRAQILEALQISVQATPERAEVSGIIPSDLSSYLPCNMHRHDNSASNKTDAGYSVPFFITLDLRGSRRRKFVLA